MAKNQAPVGAPPWMVTFADLMSLLVCFFVLIISFSVPDTKKLKIVAGSMRDAFGFQREMIVTGLVEVDGNPQYEYAQDLVPIAVKAKVGPIPDENDDIGELSAREDAWERIIEVIDPRLVRPRYSQEDATEARSEAARFAELERELRQAMQSVPELQRLVDNLQIEHAPDGLRIQIVDQARTSMFPLGSAAMYQPTRALLEQVAHAIAGLPNPVSISGHTDSIAFRRTDGYDNWSLSLDRADATRRVLVGAGLDPARLAMVTGKADTEHLFPEDPRDPRNRRISITLLRQEPAPPPAPEQGRPAELSSAPARSAFGTLPQTIARAERPIAPHPH
jgi:chemotaxis protein MotB